MFRRPGISTLIACQNEEATVGWCILSFLDFSDEIIVVDNGSTDSSKDICRELARQYPDKVRFFDAPHLKDLYENRQYALERSRYRWVVRADADYICYTNGEFSCMKLRQLLLNEKEVYFRPCQVWLFQAGVSGDYWHCLPQDVSHELNIPDFIEPRRVCGGAMARIFRVVPGMRFARLGRWEGVRYPRLLRRFCHNIRWPAPIWMHCNIKSNINQVYREYRTDWRELGDYHQYPTLTAYVRYRIQTELGTEDISEAARQRDDPRHLTLYQRYDTSIGLPYPTLVRSAMELNPVYRIRSDTVRLRRDYEGVRLAVFRDAAQIGKEACAVD